MRWPWKPVESESRESSYTDALINSIVQAASSQSIAAPGATAALESCSSIVARCFAAAEIKGPEQFRQALTPDVLSMIGRALIRSGEICFAIDTEGGRLSLLPCASWDVSGGAFPASWRYRLTVSGPTHIMTLNPVPGAGVVHIRLQSDPSASWRGIGPLQSASLAGKLSAETVAALGSEVGGMPRGALLPVPAEGDDPSLADLKIDLRTLGGSLATVESMPWGGDSGPTRQHDWKPVRLGADPPRALIDQAELASKEVFAAIGIPYSLVVDSMGTGQRESYRRLAPFDHRTHCPDCGSRANRQAGNGYSAKLRLALLLEIYPGGRGRFSRS